jgi:peroxiredoxin
MKLLNKLLLGCLILGGSAACGPGSEVADSSLKSVESINLKWMNADSADAVYKSDDHKSGIFVLEFYQDSCGPCNTNVSNVHTIAKEFKDESRVQVLDVGIDSSPSKYKNWIRKHSPIHPVLMDQGGKLFRSLGMSATPTMVILDCNLNEVHRAVGGWAGSRMDTIRGVINGQLTNECVRGE